MIVNVGHCTNLLACLVTSGLFETGSSLPPINWCLWFGFLVNVPNLDCHVEFAKPVCTNSLRYNVCKALLFKID